MIHWNVVRLNLFRAALTSALGLASGCLYESEPPRRLAPEPDVSSPGASRGDEVPSVSSPTPMLVDVETDQTMEASGGDGVGVFIEYGRGGKWRLWWTCDTNQSRQSCDFSVSASAEAGIVRVDTSELSGGILETSTSTTVDVRSTTTTQVHVLRLETAPGAVLTVGATVGGLRDASFLFFVQDGAVNGGFSGKLTNPLQLRGTEP